MGLVYTNTYFIAKVEGNPHPKNFIHVGDHPNLPYYEGQANEICYTYY